MLPMTENALRVIGNNGFGASLSQCKEEDDTVGRTAATASSNHFTEPVEQYMVIVNNLPSDFSLSAKSRYQHGDGGAYTSAF